jgi:hypothetical protein
MTVPEWGLPNLELCHGVTQRFRTVSCGTVLLAPRPRWRGGRRAERQASRSDARSERAPRRIPDAVQAQHGANPGSRTLCGHRLDAVSCHPLTANR